MQKYHNFLSVTSIIILTSIIAACGGSKAQTKSNADEAQAQSTPQVVDVKVASAIRRDLPEYFEATGSLASDEQTDVAPTVGGKVVAVNFDVGSYVRKGDVLVRLDDRDARIRLEQVQAQIAQQETAVKQSQTQVAQAEANLNQTRARIGLRANQRYDVNQIAEVKSAKAALDLAEKQLKRFERLLETGDISRAQYDQQKAQRDQVRSQYDASLNTANQSYAGIAASQASVDTARAAVRSAQSGVDAAQTQIASGQKAISDAVIYSPISGVVGERNADPGEFISTTGKIATIARTNPLRMRIEIPEQNIASVRVGQQVSLQVSSYNDRNFSGTIARIVPALNQTSRTLIAEAEVNNIEGILRAGQFATVRILLPKSRSAVLIPAAAIRQEGTSSRIFVIKDGRAEMRVVQTGDNENELVEISNGIAADERVATSNLELLVDGAEVKQ